MRLALWTGMVERRVVGEPALAVALHGELRRRPRDGALDRLADPGVEERVRGEHGGNGVRLARRVEAPAGLHVEAVCPAARLGLALDDVRRQLLGAGRLAETRVRGDEQRRRLRVPLLRHAEERAEIHGRVLERLRRRATAEPAAGDRAHERDESPSHGSWPVVVLRRERVGQALRSLAGVVRVHRAGLEYAPRTENSAGIVRARSFRSLPSDQFGRRRGSRASPSPRTGCRRGRAPATARSSRASGRAAGGAQPSTWRSSSRISGRGPTRLISPRSTLTELRQLVERGAAQEAADARHPRVVGDLEHRSSPAPCLFRCASVGASARRRRRPWCGT